VIWEDRIPDLVRLGRPMRKLFLLCCSIVMLALAATAAAAPISAGPRHAGPAVETILAGGALAICSDLAPRSCREAPAAGREPSRYRLDAEGIARASDARLWAAAGTPTPEAIVRWLDVVAADAGDDVQSAAAINARFEAQPRDNRQTNPWLSMTDAEQGSLLSALEVPQLGGDGERVRERADPRGSREAGGLAVFEAFVAAARERSGGVTPKIAVVTASAFDPMEPVDFYESAFEELGAQGRWWPVDGAMAKARFPERDCAALPALRMSELGLAGREQVYPDLAARAAAFCAADDAALDGVHGVFFAGGDQWRLRQAFFDAEGRPNAWLAALRAAHARGELVVGGTSAGAAVQSGAAMLTNGSVAAALEGRISRQPPPEPGCGRAGRCPPGLAEDDLSLWMGGGLGLAQAAIVDTHFSERARELRLLVAMEASDADWGYGADEASALRVRDVTGGREIDALGARGGWVFRRAGPRTVLAWYLAPGVRLTLEDGAVRLVGIDDRPSPRRPKAPIPSDALEPGALRAAAARLAWRCGRSIRMVAGARAATIGCIEGATRAWVGDNGVAGVGPLRLELAAVEVSSESR
jgi:cyanophycinase